MLPSVAIGLDIIIVNWNSGNQLRECLNSICSASRNGFQLKRVVVVDNASTDSSTNGLDGFELPIHIIHNKSNRGFSAACNQGAKVGDADYLLFLNPDSRLFKDSLAGPLEFLEQPQSSNIGILGIQLVDEHGHIERWCARFPTKRQMLGGMLGLDKLFPETFLGHFMTEWDHRDSRMVDQVIGAFFLVRQSVFQMLCGFDERFFVYFEEVDFALRAKQVGYSSFYYSEVSAFHRGGGSSGKVRSKRLFFFLRSRSQYCYKHLSQFDATIITVSSLLIEPIPRVLSAIAQRSFVGLVETVKGYAKFWRVLPSLFRSLWMMRYKEHVKN